MVNTVSGQWLDNQAQELTSEALVRLSFDVGDRTQNNHLIYDSGNTGSLTGLSQPSQILGDAASTLDFYDDAAFATLEQNNWVLNGSRRVLEPNFSAAGSVGFVGDTLSNQTGSFPSAAYGITIKTASAYDVPIPGLTIIWSEALDEFASDFIVSFYAMPGSSGTTYFYRYQAQQNYAPISYIPMPAQYANRNVGNVRIEISRWCLPHHRARIERIYFGLAMVYDKNSLMSLSFSQVVDPLSLSLPKSEVRFSVANIDGWYNLNNPNGLTQYLSERQVVTLRTGFKYATGRREMIPQGVYYLSEWTTPQNGLQANFVARDLIEFLTVPYDSTITPITTYMSIVDVAIAVLLQAQLPLLADGSNPWRIDETLRQIMIDAPPPQGATLAECLQLLANVGCSVLYQDRNGVLQMKPWPSATEYTYPINDFNSYARPDITLDKPIKQIDVSAYVYVEQDLTEAPTVLVETDVTTFNDDSMNVFWFSYNGVGRPTSVLVSSGTAEWNAWWPPTNGLYVKITGSNSVVHVTIMGYQAEFVENIVTIPNVNVTDGEVVAVQNELINSVAQAQAVGSWMMGELLHRMQLQFTWRADPRIDAIDTIVNPNPYNTSWVRMSEVAIDFTGAFHGSGKGRVVYATSN